MHSQVKQYRYTYIVSIIIITFTFSSKVYFYIDGEDRIKSAWKYILISIVFGWWGFPWGPIKTIKSIIDNINGGIDVTPIPKNYELHSEEQLIKEEKIWICPSCEKRNPNISHKCLKCGFSLMS